MRYETKNKNIQLFDKLSTYAKYNYQKNLYKVILYKLT